MNAHPQGKIADNLVQPLSHQGFARLSCVDADVTNIVSRLFASDT